MLECWTMHTILSQTMFAVLTGAVNSGKSFQILSVLTAQVDGDRFALPCLFIMAEASGEGTAGAVLNDPGACVVWPCSDCEQALEALRECFPESGPLTLGQAKAAAHKALVARSVKSESAPPRPPPAHLNDALYLRSLVVDTASTLYHGSVATAYRELLAAAGGKAVARSGGKGAEYNDPRKTNALAAKRCGDMLDRLNGIAMRHRGLIILVSCHTAPAMQARGDDAVCVGEGPYLGALKTADAGVTVPGYSASWNSLAAKATVVWHCFETAPDLRGKTLAEVNALASAPNAGAYGVITKKGTYPGLGAVLWVKRQGGDGPLGLFGDLPAYWHPSATVPENIASLIPTPNLGRVLEVAIELSRTDTQSAAQ